MSTRWFVEEEGQVKILPNDDDEAVDIEIVRFCYSYMEFKRKDQIF